MSVIFQAPAPPHMVVDVPITASNGVGTFDGNVLLPVTGSYFALILASVIGGLSSIADALPSVLDT